MKTARFMMDNGAGIYTHLWRVLLVQPAQDEATCEATWVWRDAPAGHEWEISLHEIDGHPVDDFGEQLAGKFL